MNSIEKKRFNDLEDSFICVFFSTYEKKGTLTEPEYIDKIQLNYII